MKLLYFIFGIFFIQYFMPILDAISSWFLTWTEAKKSKQNIIINDTNIKIRQATASADQNLPKRAIGFCASNSKDYKNEEDEDEI